MSHNKKYLSYKIVNFPVSFPGVIVLVGDKHLVVIKHRHEPHQTPAKAALSQSVAQPPNGSVKRVCASSVFDVRA